MLTYVINLDHRPDRWQHMQCQLDRLELPAVRIAAIHGIQVDPELLARTGRKNGYQSVSPNEMGCSLSHRIAWKNLLDNGQEWALVLEDDVDLSGSLPDFLRRWPCHSTAFEVVRLEARADHLWLGEPRLRVADHSIHPLWSSDFGTGAYLIGRSAAKKMLARQWMLQYPVDNAMFVYRDHDRLFRSVGQVVPSLCLASSPRPKPNDKTPQKFSSDILPQRLDRLEQDQIRRNAARKNRRPRRKITARETSHRQTASVRPVGDGPVRPRWKRRMEAAIRTFGWRHILRATKTSMEYRP